MADEFFLDRVSESFPEKVIESCKMAVVKVGRNSFANVVYTGGAHGLSRVIKYLITGEISNLLLTAGIAELHSGNVSLGKWVNTFLASDKGKGEDAARGDKAVVANATMALIKGIEIIPLE